MATESTPTTNPSHPQPTRWGRFCDWFSKHFSIGYYERHAELPPPLRPARVFLTGFVTLLSLGCVVFQLLWSATVFEPLLYFPLLLLLAGTVLLRADFHNHLLRQARQVVRGQVESLKTEAATVERRLDEPERPEHFTAKKNQLDTEVKRLDKLGPLAWTEWQVLSLQTMLVDFLHPNDLMSRARLYLDTLQEYANDSAYPYERTQYEQKKHHVEHAITNIEQAIQLHAEEEILVDDAAEPLRAELRSLIEYTAEYEESWARGAVLLSGLKFCCGVSIPFFLLMGLLPITPMLADYPQPLAWFNFSFLGAAGAVITVLLTFVRSNEVEVGHVHGRREVSRALLAIVVGFFAGAIMYAFMGSGIGNQLLNNVLVPDVASPDGRQALLSVFWAMASGLFFEWIVEKLRKTVV